MAFTSTISLSGGFVDTEGDLTAAARLGVNDNPNGEQVFTDGDDTFQIFRDTFTITPTSYQEYDLQGGNGELDALNLALSMDAVYSVIIIIDTPVSGQSIRFGPQNRTNAAQLWFQDVTANFYTVVKSLMYMADTEEGWLLDATHKVLALYNAGADDISGTIWVIGRSNP